MSSSRHVFIAEKELLLLESPETLYNGGSEADALCSPWTTFLHTPKTILIQLNH
jgi:hypothetical protein